jgi:MFS transporter, PAT family, beta-lactamase induction signal transducer AmpG
MATVSAPSPHAAGAGLTRRGAAALYLLLGFSAGLPFYMFSTVLSVRLSEHGVPLAVIGFFAWVQLLPTFKFVWAPLVDRLAVPGFARFWGRRVSWIMLAQLGILSSLLAMAATADDASLALTALFAVLLAFWTTTLEVAADAWRIELAPTPELQGPLTAANLWGYRSAMVGAGSGALLMADRGGWTAAYLLIAAGALAPLPILAALPPLGRGGDRMAALAKGLGVSAAVIVVAVVVTGQIGYLLLSAAGWLGIDARANVTPWVLGLAMLPFVLMAAALPAIRRATPDSRLRSSPAWGPYVDFFWRYGVFAIVLMAFVSIYRMGDVLALNLSKPMILGLGYTKTEIGWADGVVALAASMLGVGLGGWMVTRWRAGVTLGLGALFAALGNLAFVWLAAEPPGRTALYLATAADQFGNGLAGTVFVVYLSMLVNPRFAGAQYAFLSGFAFLLPRLIAGAGGAVVSRLDGAGYAGFDLFFLASAALSLAAILFLPLIARARPRKA